MMGMGEWWATLGLGVAIGVLWCHPDQVVGWLLELLDDDDWSRDVHRFRQRDRAGR